MGAYRTAARRGESVHVVQKSKFLGVCAGRCRKEGAAAIGAAESLHHGARHRAMRSSPGPSAVRATAETPGGRRACWKSPKNGGCDTLIVVTAVFRRSAAGRRRVGACVYGGSGEALEDARPVTMLKPSCIGSSSITRCYSRLPAFLGARAEVVGEEFGEDVKVDLAVRSEDADAFRAAYAALTEGRGIIRETGSGRRAWSDEE